MAESTEPTAEQMAADLIAHVKRTHTPRLALLEDRIAATLRYLDLLEQPNVRALSHVRAFLNGRRDDQLIHFLPSKGDGS